jgi:hypothetical protein
MVAFNVTLCLYPYIKHVTAGTVWCIFSVVFANLVQSTMSTSCMSEWQQAVCCVQHSLVHAGNQQYVTAVIVAPSTVDQCTYPVALAPAPAPLTAAPTQAPAPVPVPTATVTPVATAAALSPPPPTVATTAAVSPPPPPPPPPSPAAHESGVPSNEPLLLSPLPPQLRHLC